LFFWITPSSLTAGKLVSFCQVFQSLFFWITPSSDRGHPRQQFPLRVSILVLLDHALKPDGAPVIVAFEDVSILVLLDHALKHQLSLRPKGWRPEWHFPKP
jgi:hypothetical protein